MLTPAELAEMLSLDPATGRIYWRGNSRAGKEAGTTGSEGYRLVVIRWKQYPIHRVVFALTHGRWPVLALDHINGIRDDNRPENLREATPIENGANRGIARNNTSGFHGVYKQPGKDTWWMRIKVAGQTYELHGFVSALDAAKAQRLVSKLARREFAPALSRTTRQQA